MLAPIRTITKEEYPFLLQKITALPKKMEVIGKIPDDTHKYLCVIGSRRPSTYGIENCKALIRGLKGYPIVIVSGLAVGIDSLAHEEAIRAGLITIAFPGSGLSDSVIYPPSSRTLARRIVEAGGALLSPFNTNQTGADWTFPARNRLMAGTAHATLIIEGKKDSGTLITAEFAADFSRDLLAVPGPIFTPLSYGSNNLLRDGATAVTCSEDILEALGWNFTNSQQSLLDLSLLPLDADEKNIMELLRLQPHSSSDLIQKIGLSSTMFNIKMSELELRGLVHGNNGVYRFGPAP
jgi:DNA processing protein